MEAALPNGPQGKKVSVGRVVLYAYPDGQTSPAIVTVSHGRQIVDLTVFKPGYEDHVSSVRQAIAPGDVGAWQWPELV